jgi:hypothetical protein
VSPRERDALVLAARAAVAIASDIEERAEDLIGRSRSRRSREALAEHVGELGELVEELAEALSGLGRAFETIARGS